MAAAALGPVGMALEGRWRMGEVRGMCRNPLIRDSSRRLLQPLKGTPLSDFIPG
jgi:hypothetical protein